MLPVEACDYACVQELTNEHRTLRQMLGHGWLDEEKCYGRPAILDNVSQITPEVLLLLNGVDAPISAQDRHGAP